MDTRFVVQPFYSANGSYFLLWSLYPLSISQFESVKSENPEHQIECMGRLLGEQGWGGGG